jgi:hypothetical protein
MALGGPSRSHENEPPLRLFSHQYLKVNISEALPALVGNELSDEQPEGVRIGSGGVLSILTPL